MSKTLYLSGLDDVLNNAKFYNKAGYRFDINKLVDYMRRQNDIVQRQFISVMYMIDCIETDVNNLCEIVSNQYKTEHKIANKAIQDSVYNYLAKVDSLIDYVDKLSNKISVNKNSFDRKNIDTAVKIGNYRDEVLHEGIPFIHVKNVGERRAYGGSVCCQMADEIIFEKAYIEIEFLENKKIDLNTLINTTVSPIKEKINKYFENLLI
ncbi:MAG: hypothetical protein PHE29_03675 [Tissierellia bacterium]|nr:hypothetical protein [Tissierellia bacterium]